MLKSCMKRITEKLLVTIPHSSEHLPPEININSVNKNAIDDIIFECDEGSNILYDFRNELHNKQIMFPYHRAFIDVNQHPKDINNSIPIKSFFNKNLYNIAPTLKDRKDLLIKYHKSFHNQVKEEMQDCLLLFDGHSTLEGDLDDFGDRFDADIVISNYQIDLENKEYIYTCDDELLDTYEYFLRLYLPMSISIKKNTKYITNTYGYIEGKYGSIAKTSKTLPVLLQETNEDLYISNKEKNIDKLKSFNRVFASALKDTMEIYFGI